jgi:iron complex outermembrane receptor protein
MQWDKVGVTLGGRYDWAKQDSLNRVTATQDSHDKAVHLAWWC